MLEGVTIEDTADPSVITWKQVAINCCLTLASVAFLSFPKSLPSPSTKLWRDGVLLITRFQKFEFLYAKSEALSLGLLSDLYALNRE